ncbi:hypothetical protein [Actinoplanes sp. NPDC051411]|uniref:hypothetical protein n=1 Tax=Actinoplanes sp. NPDC051411 TaxID=3155522 RepID=UPI00343487D4
MYRNRRNRMSSRARKVVIGVTAAAIVGGAWAISTGVSGASENNAAACAGFDQAIQNNLNFIADQQAHPTGVSAANIENRRQVIDNINVTRKAAGCTEAAPAAGAAPAAPPAQSANNGGKAENGNAGNAGSGNAAGSGAGDVVCKGSTVTLSGTAGAPAASSNAFPIGTSLKVTNTDNNKSITVKVTEPSGSCVLLNDAAFNQIHEDGKLLIRHAIIERVG